MVCPSSLRPAASPAARPPRRLGLALLLAAGVAGPFLSAVLGFVSSPASAAGAPGARARRAGVRHRKGPAVAYAEGDGAVSAVATGLRPTPPNSTAEMTRQAAEASMAAYRDGITRQTVRLRLDSAYRPEDNYFAGIAAKLKGTLPLAQSYTKKLWGGELLKDVRTQAIDEDVGTLLYRQASDGMYDAAVFFLVGRSLVTSNKLRGYFDMMGDRLVVLLNSEDAADPFKVQNRARDFVIGEDADAGAEVTQLFENIPYYYAQGSANNWQTLQFRSYPHPWQIWVENLDYNLELIGEFDLKPTYDQIVEATEAYEEKNNIRQSKKLAKMMKDQGSEVSAFGMAQMNPGEGRKL